MIDLFASLFVSPALPVMILFGGGLVVVCEAVRSSRHALWGDMFAEDGDE
jgi:hypothetical protein